MEQFVLGIFQEQLSKFIVGFRKEQVNANLLNGKGEIHNVELNCAFLNEELSKVTPYIQLETVTVSKLAFHVSSWANIRKAPIVVDVEHVQATVVEPLHFRRRKERRRIRQVTNAELIEMIRAGLLNTAGSLAGGKTQPYNLFDRILDNLTVEVASVEIRYQSWGKFKTRRPGPWTPPEVIVTLGSLRLVSVNEFGQEAPPEEVWRHNHARKGGSFLLYKKIEMEYQVAIQPVGADDPIPLIAGGGNSTGNGNGENKLEVHLAVQRRIKDGAWLSLQVDVTIPTVEVTISSDVIPLLAQVVSGATYCLAKDREFVDPLKPITVAVDGGPESSVGSSGVVVDTDHNISVGDLADQTDLANGEVVDIDEEAISSDEEDESEKGESKIAPGGKAPLPTPPAQSQQSPVRRSNRPLLDSASQEKPVIILPNGMIIYDKISLSVSMHNVQLKGNYGKEGDGYMQMVVKGCVAEAIWPKVTNEKGGYVQASVSYVAIEEKCAARIRTLLVGGVTIEGSGPPEDARKPLMEVANDESFPLYEERSVRPDPLGMRHSFPAQALGFKASLDFITRSGKDAQEIQVLNEIGLEKFNVVLDAQSWSRAIRFALNETGGGFDSRWQSGDWSNELTTDMLVAGSGKLRLDDHLQETKEIFLDENDLISSDLFNLTMRITDVVMTVPAAVETDLRSCDVVLTMGETMIVVSSALPRTMLSGRIGTAVNGDDSQSKGSIDFPNDPSDVAYVLEQQEDPSKRQRGEATSRPISTFRSQITCRNFSVELVPIIPSCSSTESQLLLAPSEFSTLLCFEGAPSGSSDKGSANLVLFLSIVVHRCALNIDFNLIEALLATTSSHIVVCEETFVACSKLLRENKQETVSAAISDGQVHNSMRGRRIIVERQFRHSRQNGGLSVACCVQVAELEFNLWRQNVPLSALHRFHRKETFTDSKNQGSCDLLLVAQTELSHLEFGIEGSFQGSSRRLVSKLCLTAAKVSGPDTSEILTTSTASTKGMVPLFVLGDIGGKAQSESSFSLRIEECKSKETAWSLSAGLCDFKVTLDIETVCKLCILVAEEVALSSRLKESISALVHTSFKALRSRTQEKMPTDFTAGIERILSFCVPRNLHLILLRLHIENSEFVLPVQHSGDDSEAGFTLFLHESDFKLGYFLSGDATRSALLNVRAEKGISWASLLDFVVDKPSFKHNLSSRQSLRSLSSPGASLMAPFDLGYSYGDSLDTEIAPQDSIELVKTKHFLEFIRGVEHFTRTAWSTLKVMKTSLMTGDTKIIGAHVFADLFSRKIAELLSKFGIVRSQLENLVCSVSSREYMLRCKLREYEEREKKLQVLCFKKERERIAALSVVSADVAGWLRMGCAQRSGQRGMMTCTLWPYWCVLRHSLVIVYRAPGLTEPVEIIPIGGASLEQLTGGRKADLKRAMALVETSGMVRLMVAGTDAEFYVWVKGFLRYAESLRTSKQDEELHPPLYPDHSAHSLSQGDSSDHNNVGFGGERKPRFARMAQAAKATREKAIATRQAVADRRKMSTDKQDTETASLDSTGMNEADMDSSENSATRRNRLSGVGNVAKSKFADAGQVTKNRFGSALQVARQKGKEAAARTRSRLGSDSAHDSQPEKDVANQSLASTGAEESMETDGIMIPTDSNSTGADPVPIADASSEGTPRRAGMRQRLGAAVKNVRRNPRHNDDPDHHEIDGCAPPSIRLKNIMTDGPISSPRYPFKSMDLDEIPLKRFDGSWFVRVDAKEETVEQTEEQMSPVATDGTEEDMQSYKPSEVLFTTQIFCFKGNGSDVPPTKTASFTIPQMLSFHASLSEAITRCLPSEIAQEVNTGRDSTGAMKASLARALGMSALDAIKITGELLEGLLTCESPDTDATLRYKAEVVSEFLNSMLQTAIPIDALVILVDFLGIPEECSSSAVIMPSTDSAKIAQTQTDDATHDTSAMKLSQLLKSAQSNNIWALDRLTKIHQHLVSQAEQTPQTTNERAHHDVRTDLLVPSGGSSSKAFHDAVHTVLVKVMAERDESHARMVAAGVLHVHEVEQYRKQVKRLTTQLEAKAGNINGTGQAQNLQRNMQQDSDMELVSLCQQLAGEISARTNASLEVIRLKETREIERRTEDAEKQSLIQDTSCARKDLAVERERAAKAEQELEQWKSAYEALAAEKEEKG